MFASERELVSEAGHVSVEHLRQTCGGSSVDQFGHLINKLGAPVPGVGVDKTPELINSAASGDEAQVRVEDAVGGAMVGDGNRLRRSEAADLASRTEQTGDDGGRLQAALGSSFGAGIGRGRPAAITPALQDRICTLLSVGFSRRQAAAYVEIDQSTISRTAKRDPEFAACLKRAEEKASLQPMLTVISEAQKNWRAAAWLLQYKARQPVVLSEEEKQELHEQRLVDARRRAAESKAWSDAMWEPSDPSDPLQEGCRQLRESMSRKQTVSKQIAPKRIVRVKTSGKGKRRSVTRTVVTTGRTDG
jgi:hypothetical protein